MPTETLDTEAWGSALASWRPLTALLVGFAIVVVGLLVAGRGRPLDRIPDALGRLTGMPAWAIASAGTAAYGLLIAGEGFYSDVWWHIALGRDKALFTAPHTSIVVGLGMIFVAAAVGITVATVTEVDTRLRLGALRVPWSMVPLGALGASALAGFPLDELWHEQYGIDVTMWSPTHMLMILGASFTGLACWLVLAEAGISPRDSKRARAAHVAAAALTVLGLSASQGEFEFGVPQFQLMFLPMLVTIVAAFSYVAIRLVHGPGWAIGIGLAMALARTGILGGGDGGPSAAVETRAGGLYVVSALVVEVVALLAGTDRRLRFALLSGIGVATVGLAGEWWWNQDARQPWDADLLPDAVLLCLVVGIGAALVGTAFGSVVAARAGAGVGAGAGDGDGAGAGAGVGGTGGEVGTGVQAGTAAGAGDRRARSRPGRGSGRGLPGRVVALGGVAVVVALALPMPRAVGDVTADVTLEPDGIGSNTEDYMRVRVELEPADAAEDARWFQVMAWQGGGLVIAELEQVGPGEYMTERAVPTHGRWKTVLRLHRGGELMAVPLYLPEDPEIGEEEIPAVDRSAAFSSESEFLLREAEDGDAWFAWVVYGLLALVGVAWAVSFTLASRRITAAPAPAPAPPPGGPGPGSDLGSDPGLGPDPDRAAISATHE